MAKSLANLVEPIADVESWNSWMEQSENLLLVLDCHQDWCGYCETMLPTFQRIFLEYDDSANRIKFLSANLKDLQDQVTPLIPEDSGINIEAQGCMPFFILVRFKQTAAAINGANAPTLMQAVAMNIPDAPKDEEEN
mmetsp:Transcript_15384/g.22616  ORF Transcript_15384/g.22616 Transcript_15384/m.22616 type:complete len:137 (-) Transcript_15384:308-718(-)|eukprot:CAMPEP_0113938100 /NCGR_PEP_ID=MMETSP1339-20121228/4506_1 /TAXON_ID=94617 /ORGANISM="Fibrocapsa japonica" /LENGTH=136 /DNA_ID=CAMNT_0000941037 /DNA_START=28 /DNA_END=438 /DNA_ORIENTATION=- /assembly_acc=CAM_ASM_000762